MSKKPFLKTKDLAMSVEYAKSHNWDLRFIDTDIPSDFRKWFPAISVKEPILDPETHQFTIGNSSLEIISGYRQPTLTVEFYDNDKGDLENYLFNWVNKTCLGGFTFVRPLEECLKTLEVLRMDNRGRIIQKKTYQVAAKSAVTKDNGSTSSIIQYTVDFLIASMAIN